MTAITIITIVVVALLTIVIFGLTWIGYTSCLKTYRMEVDRGEYDKEILQEHSKEKKNKIRGLIGTICSYIALSLLTGLFITGIVYKANGENFTINNKTALVIKSQSMSDFYNMDDAAIYSAQLQFDIGDICIFESDYSELVIGEVYGYRYRNIIITHRLVDYDEVNKVARFKGDYNASTDPYYVSVDNIVYHYTGKKAQGIGAFILYAQSYFGLWSLCGIVGVAIGSEVICYKIAEVNKKRLFIIGGKTDEA